MAELSARDIEPALEAIASGTSSFGALEEWQVWFHYLLPRVLPRCHETFLSFGGSALLDALVTAFITQYPTGMLETPYPAFRADVLSTLGRAIMDKVCWPDGDIDVRRCLGQAVTAEFIPPRNRQLAIAAVADLVTGDTFADWLASLSTDPALEQEMADLPFECTRSMRATDRVSPSSSAPSRS